MAGLSGCSSKEQNPGRTLTNPIDANWPQKFDGVSNNMSGQSCSIATGLETIWKIQLENEWITAAPILFENKIYIGTGTGTVLAIEAHTGKSIWKRQFSGIQAALGVYDDTLIVPDQNGQLHGLELGTGRTNWSLSVNGPAVNPVTVVDGTALVTTLRGNMYVIDTGMGEVKWQRKLGHRAVAKPAVWNDLVFVPATGSSHSVYALDRHDGTNVWEHIFDKSVTKSVRVFKDSVYVFGNRGNIVGPSTGRHRGSVFRVAASDGVVSQSFTPHSILLRGNDCDIQSVVVSSQDVYISACNVIFSFDKKGREKWQLEVENGVATDLIACENSLLFADFDGVLHRVSRTGRASRLTAKIHSNPTTPCILGDKLIFCGNQSVALLRGGAQ